MVQILIHPLFLRSMRFSPKVHIGILFTIFLLAGTFSKAQVRVVLDTAANLSGKVVDGVFINMATGNVEFTQNNTKIYCDSALIYRNENRVEAFGRVRIVENDSTTITARRANYDGNAKVVEFRDNVVFRQKGGISLFTNILDYDRELKEAVYRNGGRLVDSTNVLTSTRGYYNEYSKMASFGGNVEGTNPEWDLESDTLQYNSRTKVIYFHSPTLLTNKEGETATYNSGSYDTENKESNLSIGEFETEAYYLKGRRIGIDEKSQLYRADGNVRMIAKEDEVIITGQSAVYDKNSGITKVWNNPVMKKAVAEGDTLYMRADTLVSVEIAKDDDYVLAYHNVAVYKSDLQGLSDSLSYRPADSTIYFYTDPILWTDGTQLTADTMKLLISNNTLKTLTMNAKSFIISRDSANNFNQVKGRNMITHFKDQEIDKVDVNGNGESIYFVMEEDGEIVMGMNKVVCSNMLIRFDRNMVETITFYKNNEGDFIPPHEITEEQKTLPGFRWQIEKKPSLEDVLYLRIQPLEKSDER